MQLSKNLPSLQDQERSLLIEDQQRRSARLGLGLVECKQVEYGRNDISGCMWNRK